VYRFTTRAFKSRSIPSTHDKALCCNLTLWRLTAAGVHQKYLFEILVYARWPRSNENVTVVPSKQNHRTFNCNGIKFEWNNRSRRKK